MLKVVKTEKAVQRLEFDKVLTLLVDYNMNKEMIKKEVENQLNVKVVKVRTMNSKQGKVAFIKLDKDTNVNDLAGKLKLI